jgi:ParB family chromosome partitioning protein
MTRAEIARKRRKTAAWVTQHLALLKLPPPIQQVYDSGRCRDVTLIFDLANLHKRHAAGVESWLEDEDQDITRGPVRLLREYLDESSGGGANEDTDGDDDAPASTGKPGRPAKAKPKGDASVLSRPVVMVRSGGKDAILLIKRRPSGDGLIWVQYEDGSEEETTAAKIKLVAIGEQ